LEGRLAEERIEVDHLKALLLRSREKTDEDKDSLKKATRFETIFRFLSSNQVKKLVFVHLYFLNTEV